MTDKLEHVEYLRQARASLDDPGECDCEACTTLRERITKPTVDCLIGLAERGEDLVGIAIGLSRIMGCLAALLVDDPDCECDPADIAGRVIHLSEQFTRAGFRAVGMESQVITHTTPMDGVVKH